MPILINNKYTHILIHKFIIENMGFLYRLVFITLVVVYHGRIFLWNENLALTGNSIV